MSIFRCHIKDSTICEIPISKLTQGDFYLFIESLSHTRARKTVLNIMQFCSQVLNHAMKRKLIEYNWANPDVTEEILLDIYYSGDSDICPEKNTSAYTTEESEKLIKAAKCRNLVLGVLIQYLIQTGAMRGEALGLKFSDIDFEKKQIFICRNVTRRNNAKAPADGSGRKTEVVCERALKTLCSTRYIDVDDDILNALSDLREYQINEMGIEKPEFCFITPDGKIISPDRVLDFMKAAVANAGIRELTVHELRHTYATNLFHDTKDIYYVSKQLGHTNINTTRRYIEQFQD